MSEDTATDMSGDESPHFNVPVDSQSIPGEVQPWEEVEVGRFMPRRVRGSCVGRALG